MGTGKKENCDKNAENTHSEVSGKDFIALSSPVSSTIEIMKMTLFIVVDTQPVGIIMTTPSNCPGSIVTI